MVNFADCVSKVQCRNLVAKKISKEPLHTLLEVTGWIDEAGIKNWSRNGHLVETQKKLMYEMGAKDMRKNTELKRLYKTS